MTSPHDCMDDAEHITRTHELLTYTARRAQDRPAYVAWALARVKAREGLSDEALAARLGIATVDLTHLALCLRPRPEHWAEDVAQIATKFGLAPEPLAVVLRAVEAPAARRHDPTG
jgi:DNA-binding phage protein